MSRSPYRLLALHAVELYLNAFLVASGHPPAALRRLHHDLGSRTRLALEARLGLRARTALHLAGISERREYLVSRYDPTAVAASELNRIAATLAEVARKVDRAVTPPPCGSASSRRAVDGQGSLR